jgi:hypothetical protein
MRVRKTRSTSRGTVGYLRHEHETLAQLYAAKTGRDYLFLASLENFHRFAEIEIVLALFSDLTPDLFDAIHEKTITRKAPGILCASSSEQLSKKIKWKLDCIRRSNRPRGSFIDEPLSITDILPLSRFKIFQKNYRTILGSDASLLEVERALTSGADLLRIVTTSDGIDADLGAGKVLCPFDRRFHQPSRSIHLPLCIETGFCHRIETSLKGLSETPRIFFACDVRAGILIWDTCSGVMSFSRTIDDHWGMGRRFIDSLGIGALVTTIDCAVVSPANSEKLVRSLIDGRTLADGVTEYARSASEDPLTHRMFIFGDPDTKIDIPQPIRDRIPRILPSPSIAKCLEDDIEGVDSELQLMLSIVENGPARLQKLRKRIRRDLKKYPLSKKSTELLRMNLIEYMAARQWARWADDWTRLSAGCVRSENATVCPLCDSQGHTLIYDFATGSRRKSTVCPRCGPIEDAPLSSDLRFLVQKDRCELLGSRPTNDWLAYLVIFSGRSSETLLVKWPANREGKPVDKFCPPIKWPRGPLRVAFHMIAESWFILSHPYRTKVSGRYRTKTGLDSSSLE